MGTALIEAINNDIGTTYAGGIDTGGDAIALARIADTLIDFSVPAALVANLGAAVAAGKPIVIGTTGLNADHHRAIDDAAHHVPVLQTGNTSLGITVLARLVQEAAARLGPDWDIEILEMHHRHKVDAPSGTALLLGEAAARGRAVPVFQSPDGQPRTPGATGFASLRGGSVAGDHSVILAGEGERIELIHRAENRDIFARGALHAALWLGDKPAGRYVMGDVLRV